LSAITGIEIGTEIGTETGIETGIKIETPDEFGFPDTGRRSLTEPVVDGLLGIGKNAKAFLDLPCRSAYQVCL
jgi:hypothetical protein